MIAPLYWYKEHGKGVWEWELGGHFNLENLLLIFVSLLLSTAWSESSEIELQAEGLGEKREN